MALTLSVCCGLTWSLHAEHELCKFASQHVTNCSAQAGYLQAWHTHSTSQNFVPTDSCFHPGMRFQKMEQCIIPALLLEDIMVIEEICKKWCYQGTCMGYAGTLSSLFYAIFNFQIPNITLRVFFRLHLFSKIRPKTYSTCNQETTKDCEHLPMTGARSTISCLLEKKRSLLWISINFKFTVEIKLNTRKWNLEVRVRGFPCQASFPEGDWMRYMPENCIVDFQRQWFCNLPTLFIPVTHCPPY